MLLLIPLEQQLVDYQLQHQLQKFFVAWILGHLQNHNSQGYSNVDLSKQSTNCSAEGLRDMLQHLLDLYQNNLFLGSSGRLKKTESI